MRARQVETGGQGLRAMTGIFTPRRTGVEAEAEPRTMHPERTMRRSSALVRGAFLVLCALLSGCWQGPGPAASDEASTYAWRADLQLPVPDDYYRFDPTDVVKQTADASTQRAFAVFDARGQHQSCGRMELAADALTSVAVVEPVVVSSFDPNRCISPAPACFVGQACGVSAECPRVEIDLHDTALEKIASVAQLLDAANASLDTPHCQLFDPASTRNCDEGDVGARSTYGRLLAARTLARTTLTKRGLGKDENPGSPNMTMRSSNWVTPNPMPNRPPAPPHHWVPLPQAPFDLHEGYALLLEREPEKPLNLQLLWDAPVQSARSARALMQWIDAEGKPQKQSFAINELPFSADSRTTSVGWPVRSRAARIAFADSAPPLHLIGATAIRYVPKAFMQDSRAGYWFKAAGQAPYALLVDPRAGECGNGLRRDVEAVAAKRDADWPRAARVGAATRNPRSAVDALHAEHPDYFLWLNWSAGVVFAWLAGMSAVLLRWLILRRRARVDQRR